MKNIVLTGFMASGKTVIGKKISKLTGYKFIDMDLMIEEKEGKSINDIFALSGEKYFRDLESLTAIECANLSKCVISCGGGVVLRKENINNLRKNGIIFNLNPTEEVIKKRLSSAAETRPLLKKDDIQDALDRFEKRKPFYDNCDFKIQIDTNTTIEFAAKEIIEIYSNFQKNGGI